jgi:L-fuconolactonase
MLIVDAQVHIWAASTPERPWPTPPPLEPHRPVQFTKDDLLREMDAAGVNHAVIVPPSRKDRATILGCQRRESIRTVLP